MSPQDAIRKWWMQVVRLGMTPSEAADTMLAAISDAGFEIVPKRKREPGLVEKPNGPRPLMTNAIAGEGQRRGVFSK
jgi:hypothetical protein